MVNPFYVHQVLHNPDYNKSYIKPINKNITSNKEGIMSEFYQNIETKKATVKIEKSLYLFVKGNLYHGQLSKLVQNVFASIQMLIQNGKIKDIILYISGQRNLTLPRVIQKKERG